MEVEEKITKIKRAYKKYKKRTVNIAASSLAVIVPQQLVALISFVIVNDEESRGWGSREICFISFTSLGLILCLLQALLVTLHRFLLVRGKMQDLKNLDHELPDMEFNRSWWRVLEFLHILIISLYTCLFVVSGSVISNLAGAD